MNQKGGGKFLLRLPDGLLKLVRVSAAENERSINSEVIYHLKRAYVIENEKSGTTA